MPVRGTHAKAEAESSVRFLPLLFCVVRRLPTFPFPAPPKASGSWTDLRRIHSVPEKGLDQSAVRRLYLPTLPSPIPCCHASFLLEYIIPTLS